MILERLEQLPVGSFQYKLLFITGLGWLFDSMDTGLIAFVLPVLAKEWSLTPAQVGWIGSIGLIGMALGAVLAGTLADRIGRKKVFTITVLLYSLSTGMCALSWSYESLLFFRFLVGFGLGGELPVAATLMSEYAPSHLRGRFIVLLESFWGIGWLVAACIAYLLIPAFGWKIAFAIGTLPALYVFLIRLHMPESIRYLISQNRINDAKQIILDLEAKLQVNSQAFAAELSDTEKGKNSAVAPKFAALWTKPFRTRTAMLWLAWFGIVFSYYGIFMWLPSIVYAQGFAVVKTFEYVLIMTLAQLPGYYAAAWLVDIIGRKYTLSLFLLLSDSAASFKEYGKEKVNGSDAIGYNGKITSDELRQALELANAKQALEESLDVELDDDVFEDLGDVPVSIWIDVKSGMIVRVEMDMSDVMQGLVPVLVDKAMEKTDVGIGVDTKVYEVTVSITLSEFDAVQVTKPTTLNIG